MDSQYLSSTNVEYSIPALIVRRKVKDVEKVISNVALKSGDVSIGFVRKDGTHGDIIVTKAEILQEIDRIMVNTSPHPTVVVYVEGGLVQAAYGDNDVDVIVLDHDDGYVEPVSVHWVVSQNLEDMDKDVWDALKTAVDKKNVLPPWFTLNPR